MRFFTTLATFGLVALVSAQTVTDSSTSTAASITESSAPASTSLTVEAKCLQACDASDICCQAACVNVPCPSQLQANETTACAAQCPQGNGSPADTSSYAACQASCVSSLFFSSSVVTGAAATGTSGGSGAGSGSAASASATATATSGSGSSASSGSSGSSSSGATGSSNSGSGTASATGSAASSSSTNDASSVKNQVAGVGLIGLIIAGLAL